MTRETEDERVERELREVAEQVLRERDKVDALVELMRDQVRIMREGARAR